MCTCIDDMKKKLMDELPEKHEKFKEIEIENVECDCEAYIFGKQSIMQQISIFKEFWGSFVIYVIATSIIALFIASFVVDKNIALNDMNTWVSLILGMVALVIGVISLFLSFYNVDQSVQAQDRTLEIM